MASKGGIKLRNTIVIRDLHTAGTKSQGHKVSSVTTNISSSTNEATQQPAKSSTHKVVFSPPSPDAETPE